MVNLPYIPETAPFTAEQRAWLNGFLAGLFAQGAAAERAEPSAPAAPPASAEPLLVLFGSQTGSAEGLAKRFAAAARPRGFAPSVMALNDCAPGTLAAGGRALIISSTWGDGDPPDNAAGFWQWLNAAAAPRLEKLQFAVLGLGDRNYSDFCGASKKFDARLEALGAKRLAARGECDVDYESAATQWLAGLWDKLQGGPAAEPLPAAAPVNGHRVNGHQLDGGRREVAADPAFSRTNPFPARLLRNVRLTRDGSDKEVRHYELGLGGSGLTYEVGDALGVVPANCPELVDEWLRTLGWRGDEPVTAGGSSVPLREALTRYYDITRPSPDMVAAVAQAAPDSELAALAAPERRDELQQWLRGRDVLDLLRLLPSPLPAGQWLPLLRKLDPRLYSISSSPRAHPGEVHLTVSAVRYHSHGRPRKGVASTFLADRVEDAEFVKIFVQPARGFKPPAGGDTPMIMVGPGTGIAPFRAFLEERFAAGAKGRNWLFFGAQKSATDFLYEEQLTAWRKCGFLTRLDLAFSRDQAEKIYVQHRMLENAAELWAWLEAGAHFYVCGDAARMARDVDAALRRVIELGSGRGADDAEAYVARLRADQRYQRDVY